MNVFMLPSLDSLSREESGIRRVIEAYHRYLPALGVEFVGSADEADVTAGHAGAAIGVDVLHCHGLYWTADYPASSWEWKINANLAEAARRARVITVPSTWVAETFKRDMRVSPVVLPHGIEWDEWQGDEPARGYVLWNKNRVGDVCDPSPIRDLARRFPRVTFATTYAPERAPSNVRAFGLVPHEAMRRIVKAAGVYLATTKETFGIGILEAMAAGVPVLGYGHGGILDLVEHGVSGYLARPGDLDDLAEGLAYCISNRDRLEPAGKHPDVGPGRRLRRSLSRSTRRLP